MFLPDTVTLKSPDTHHLQIILDRIISKIYSMHSCFLKQSIAPRFVAMVLQIRKYRDDVETTDVCTPV